MGSDMTDDDDCFYYHSWRNNVIIAFGTLSSYLVGFLERKGERKKTLFLIKTQTLLSIGSTPQKNSNSVLKRQHPPKKFVWRVLPTPLSCKKITRNQRVVQISRTQSVITIRSRTQRVMRPTAPCICAMSHSNIAISMQISRTPTSHDKRHELRESSKCHRPCTFARWTNEVRILDITLRDGSTEGSNEYLECYSRVRTNI